MKVYEIFENKNLGLTIFDIDETLFRTTAQIKVVKDGQVIRSLSNQEFNTYELQPGEDFDFGEFRDAEKFNRESIPIEPMIAKLKAILKNAGDSKVIMLTARSDFDNKELFLATFEKYGIDTNRIHVHRAGNLGGAPAENKEVFIRQYLDTGDYARVRLYDDSMANIRMFNALSKEYPDVQFFPYFVTHEGGIKTIREGVGRIVKGVNTTVDVGVNQTSIEAAKFGNSVDKDGRPPTMSKRVKGKSTNVLFNLGLTEGIRLRLERDKNMDVLHIQDTKEKYRVEVRGKKGYETNGYDPNDKLHQVLDRVGKAANISELMNGEVIDINPNHPQGSNAIKTARDVLQTEAFDTDAEWVLDMDSGGIQVFATKVEDAYIELTYKRMTNDDVYISFSRGGRISVTGEGSQNKIFGAVINHIQKWVDENKPPRVVFSAFKPNTGAFGAQDTTRSGLYRKMVQRFASQNGYDYDVEDTGNEDTFILKRKETDTQTNEALDQPYPVRWTIKDDDEWEGEAIIEAGDRIQIFITQGHNNHKWEIDFYVGGSMQVTGKGDQFRVFATVVSAVKEWWSWLSKSKQPVEAIIFSAFKGNEDTKGSAGRSSLYNRFANQFARSIGFEVSTVDGSDNIKFVLSNPNYKNQQTENFADGKKPGRKGLAKRSGVNTKASVSSLRKTAKNSSGEKQRMAHWLANMKAGRQKAKKK